MKYDKLTIIELPKKFKVYYTGLSLSWRPAAGQSR